MADCFGDWVKDVPLRESKGWRTPATNRAQERDAVDNVRNALNLPFNHPLVDHAPPDLMPTVRS